MRLANRLALAIADGAARSDIECNAHPFLLNWHTAYDLSRCAQENEPAEYRQQCLLVAQRAARYIDARGDVFDFRMVRAGENKNIVWFEAKP